jgi:hypothetical protein
MAAAPSAVNPGVSLARPGPPGLDMDQAPRTLGSFQSVVWRRVAPACCVAWSKTILWPADLQPQCEKRHCKDTRLLNVLDALWNYVFVEREVSAEDLDAWKYLKSTRPSSLVTCSPRFFRSLEHQVEVCGSLMDREKRLLGTIISRPQA